MRSEAVFSGIEESILQAMKAASASILILCQEIRQPLYYKVMLEKAKAGCSVCLICTGVVNRVPSAVLNQLKKFEGQCYFHSLEAGHFANHGFCLIDDSVLISGNYDWQTKEPHYDANVVFIQEDEALIRLLHATCLNLLKGEELVSPAEVEERSSEGAQLSIWNDPAVGPLQLEKRILEHYLRAYELEKIELDKLLHDFQHRHSLELGDLLIDILHWRKEKFRDDPKSYREAEADEEAYRQEVATELKKKLFDLSEGEKQDLKSSFRKASHLCHPDKVSEALQEIARQVFFKLKAAYDANDLKTVQELLADLQNRPLMSSDMKELSKRVALEEAKRYLEEQISALLREIFAIQHSETYMLLQEIDDWDDYFQRTKELLKEELADLKAEVSEV